MALPNQVTLNQVPAGKGAMWCFANASYEQTVYVGMGTFTPIFQGAGEGVLMTSGGMTTEPFETTNPSITVTFEHSTPTDPNQPSTPASPVVIETDSTYVAQFGAEDGTDNDYNDSWLQVVVFKTPPTSGDAG